MERIPLPACGEDVAIDAEGRLLAGLEDGRVVRVVHGNGQSNRLETLVNTCGRPIGIEVDVEGSLIICDARRGLLRIDPDTRRVETLVPVGKYSLALCNNAAIASDGTIYFSDSSRRFGIDHWKGELIEHSGTGRLLRRTPNGRVEVLLEGLHFANGVALASDQSFVVVAETGAYRLTRLWLEGPRQGQSDVLIDGLPGFPDNLSSDEHGLIWIAVPTPRNWLLDVLHRSHPRWRHAVWKLPDAMQPAPSRVMTFMAIDDQGQVVHELSGRSRSFHMATGVRAHGGLLYLASLNEAALGAVALPTVSTAASSTIAAAQPSASRQDAAPSPLSPAILVHDADQN